MSTSFPATKPEANLAKANAESMDPTCALFTPKDFAKSGIVGAMIPNPTATKKDAKTSTPTSRGNSAKGLVNFSLNRVINRYPSASPAASSRAAA